MPACELDHIVIGAATLDQGVAFIRDRLGVEIGPGGRHDLMGTHNRLMRIAPNSYLEVIAIDPDAAPLTRRRWFEFDEPAMRASLETSPRIVTWVARSYDIVAALQASAVPLGPAIPASRGHLSWRITVPEDGHLPGGGTIPHLIEWDGGLRPWEAMTDVGCRFEELILEHPDPDWLKSALASVCARGFAGVSVREGAEPGLSVRIATVTGSVTI
ncbi:MAG: VOC family protein [Rhodomicrobium sp.]|nr:VOC family protein [Rhodomicrobium sp.]